MAYSGSASAVDGQLRPSCCLTDLNDTMSSIVRVPLPWLQQVIEICEVSWASSLAPLHPL
jgi:hypothetical protein